MSASENNKNNQETFFEETTIGVGFLYTIIVLGIIASLVIWG